MFKKKQTAPAEQHPEKKARIKKSHLILLCALLIGLGLSKFLQHQWGDAVIEIREEQLHVLIAQNRYQHQKGLGGRESLEPYDGMLFIFSGENNRPGIVMRDMLFPIDIVWFQQGTVVDIAQNVSPQPEATTEQALTPYYPRTYANIVLELPAGWVAAHGLKIGDSLQVIDE